MAVRATAFVFAFVLAAFITTGTALPSSALLDASPATCSDYGIATKLGMTCEPVMLPDGTYAGLHTSEFFVPHTTDSSDTSGGAGLSKRDNPPPFYSAPYFDNQIAPVWCGSTSVTCIPSSVGQIAGICYTMVHTGKTGAWKIPASVLMSQHWTPILELATCVLAVGFSPDFQTAQTTVIGTEDILNMSNAGNTACQQQYGANFTTFGQMNCSTPVPDAVVWWELAERATFTTDGSLNQ